MNNNFEIPWTELLWAGENENGELFCGHLFRFRTHYYICNNTPYTYDECKELGKCPPEISRWHEVIPSTLKKYGRDWEWASPSDN